MRELGRSSADCEKGLDSPSGLALHGSSGENGLSKRISRE